MKLVFSFFFVFLLAYSEPSLGYSKFSTSIIECAQFLSDDHVALRSLSLRKERKNVIEEYKTKLDLQSSKLKKSFDQQMKDEGYIEYPYIILGSGAHGSILSRMIKNKVPSLKG